MAYHVIEGNVVGKKEKIGIVCARFNEFIVSMTMYVMKYPKVLHRLVCRQAFR